MVNILDNNLLLPILITTGVPYPLNKKYQTGFMKGRLTRKNARIRLII